MSTFVNPTLLAKRFILATRTALTASKAGAIEASLRQRNITERSPIGPV
jgi:hypothetical protein